MDRSSFLGVQEASIEDIRNAGFLIKLEHPEPFIQVPGRFSLRSQQTPVKSQMDGNFCVPFATAACCEFVIRNGYGGAPIEDIHLSESHISHAAEKRHGDCLAGMPIWHALEVLSYFGVVTADVWPYSYNPCEISPPDRQSALWYQVRTWALIRHRERAEIVEFARKMVDEPDLKISHHASLARNSLEKKKAPVLIDIPVVWGHGWDEPTNGDIQMPSPSVMHESLKAALSEPPGTRGWHAICLTGYDDSALRFEFKNSWGPWGDGGYGTIPYDYVSAYNSQMWDSFNHSYFSQVGPFPGAI